MTRRSMALLAAVVLLAAGCGAQSDSGSDSEVASASSAAAFTDLLALGYDADFEPLRSPADAIAKGDLIISGTIVEVHDGITITYPDDRLTERGSGAFVTFEVAVDQVLAGEPSLVVDGTAYVQVAKSPVTPVSELAAANPRPAAVVILDDITDWRPSDQATVTRPTAMPDSAPILFAFTDGLWMQTPTDEEMASAVTSRQQLASAWGQPRTLDDMTQAITSAVG